MRIECSLWVATNINHHSACVWRRDCVNSMIFHVLWNRFVSTFCSCVVTMALMTSWLSLALCTSIVIVPITYAFVFILNSFRLYRRRIKLIKQLPVFPGTHWLFGSLLDVSVHGKYFYKSDLSQCNVNRSVCKLITDSFVRMKIGFTNPTMKLRTSK